MRTRAPRVRETSAEALRTRFGALRRATLDLCRPLTVEDHVVQSMPDASPAKWHLAHTTWFFEEFVLRAAEPDHAPYSAANRYLFNSYYNSVGAMHPRAARGLLSRPTVDQVLAYRAHVDARVDAVLASDHVSPSIADIVTLGCAHEEQHQELLLTDILHAFWSNPLRPVYTPRTAARPADPSATNAPVNVPRDQPVQFVPFPGGIARSGADASADAFAFDNEGPAHDVLLQPHALAQRPVSNDEFRAFVRAGGYREPALWLSEGWEIVRQEGWQHPLYWSDGLDSQFSLHGEVELVGADPVAHLSYFEADAFARWAGARLPTEHEWEHAARGVEFAGNFRDSGRLQPAHSPADASAITQMFGDVWEWTQSPYVAYPGFRASAGALGEYNGKFMIHQLVLRGGSALTPPGHVRASYRNFFHPAARWQMSGLRLAQDR